MTSNIDDLERLAKRIDENIGYQVALPLPVACSEVISQIGRMKVTLEKLRIFLPLLREIKRMSEEPCLNSYGHNCPQEYEDASGYCAHCFSRHLRGLWKMDLIDKLIESLELTFINTKGNKFVDGWYLWRNSKDWPKDEYKFVEVVDQQMRDEEPVDSFGMEWRSVWIDPYGQLAGPILDR